jgi:hypothetical protein
MLILKTLALESMHGWGVAQRIERSAKVSSRSIPVSFPGVPAPGTLRTGEERLAATENNRRASVHPERIRTRS